MGLSRPVMGLLYLFIQGVTGGTDQTSGGCSCINFVFRATGFHFDSLNPEDGTGRLYRNVGKKLATTCRVITEKTLLSINIHVKLSYFGHIQGDT